MFIELSLLPSREEKKPIKALVHRDHIVKIEPLENGLAILFSDGSFAYTDESFFSIKKKLATTGIPRLIQPLSNCTAQCGSCAEEETHS